jgi:hypothetical protein
MRKICTWTLFFCTLCVLAWPTPAAAQAGRSGPTFMVGGATSPVILPDVAYDPSRNQYLVVSGSGFIEGQLLNANGAKIAGFVVTAGSLVGGYAQTPRVVYAAGVNGGAGGYLVTWHESVGPVAQVRGKLIGPDGTPLSGDIVIATEAALPGTGSLWTMGAAVSYSTASQEFLVAWMGGYQSSQDIRFTRLNTAGQLLQQTVAITGGADWERDPSIAYNSAQNEFYIAYAGYFDAGRFGYVSGQRIQAGSGALLGPPTTFIQSAATLIPSVEYNTNSGQYLVVWWNNSGGGAAFYGVSVNGATGATIGGVRVMSSYYFAYDALDVAYNSGTGDYLLVTHGAGLQNYEDAAVHIRPDGTPLDNGFILTQTTDVRPLKPDPRNNDGNYNPRIASSTSGRYLAVTSSVFAAIHGQFATSSGGQPPPPVSSHRSALDYPRATTYDGPFPIAGWAADLGSTSGPGVNFVHVYAFPVTGATPVFLGQAQSFPRPDVAAFFGRADFANCGFLLWGALPPGFYDIKAFSNLALTGTFDYTQVPSVRINVVPPGSRPLMAIDLPAPNQTVNQSFVMAGWAVDAGAASGHGTSSIYVWAAPIAGGTPLFAGATTTGVFRADVAAAFAETRWGFGGWALNASLPPGDYDLVVYAYSTFAGSYNNYRVVRVRVVP